MSQADSENSTNTPSHIAALLAAATGLDELAAGNQPDRTRLIAAALALDTLIKTTTPSRDLLDAAAGLQILATGGTLDLDDAGRSRARQFATRFANSLLIVIRSMPRSRRTMPLMLPTTGRPRLPTKKTRNHSASSTGRLSG
jgi:hypothetical protein